MEKLTNWREIAPAIRGMTTAELVALGKRCAGDEMCGMCPVYVEEPSTDDAENCRSVLLAELANRLEELTRPGRWIYYRDDQNRLWCRCSLCSKTYGCLDTPFCPNCGHPMVDEELELRTCYCPICDRHFKVRSNDSMGSCPDCGHHVVLHGLEVAE